MKLVKIESVYCLIEDGDIIECFDTRPEAERYFEPFRLRQALETFDRKRAWMSMWDFEQKRMSAHKMGGDAV